MADRERERQANSEDSTLTRLRLHMDRAAEAFDFGGDNVHTDAAACLLGDRASGREARLQDELHGVFVADGHTNGGPNDAEPQASMPMVRRGIAAAHWAKPSKLNRL